MCVAYLFINKSAVVEKKKIKEAPFRRVLGKGLSSWNYIKNSSVEAD